MAKSKRKRKSKNKTITPSVVCVRTGANGCALTGAYKKVIPKATLNDLKTRNEEIFIDKAYLPFLVESSYTVVDNPVPPVQSQPEEAPKPGDDSTENTEDN